MSKTTYDIVMSGKRDSNIRFTDLKSMLLSFGFRERIKGDHFIYKRDDLPERINIQPIGSKAKPYQVKQIRNIFIKYKL